MHLSSPPWLLLDQCSSLLVDVMFNGPLAPWSLSASRMELWEDASVFSVDAWVPHVVCFEIWGGLQKIKFWATPPLWPLCFKELLSLFYTRRGSCLLALQRNIRSSFHSSLSLLIAFCPSSSLGICLCQLPSSSSSTPPLWNIFRVLASVFFFFFIRVMKQSEGETRWIQKKKKKRNEMKREWDTALRQCHWQRALRNVQGNTIGSCCRRAQIWILFFWGGNFLSPLHPIYVFIFYDFILSQSVCITLLWFSCICLPANLCHIILLIHFLFTLSSSRDMQRWAAPLHVVEESLSWWNCLQQVSNKYYWSVAQNTLCS